MYKNKIRYIMKKTIQILVFVMVALLPVLLSAQPHPWDDAIGGGSAGGPAGGGAPIGGGLLIMLSMAIGYGARKIYNARKK
jgi:hypothetical protein